MQRASMPRVGIDKPHIYPLSGGRGWRAVMQIPGRLIGIDHHLAEAGTPGEALRLLLGRAVVSNRMAERRWLAGKDTKR